MYAETPQDIYDYTKAFCDATIARRDAVPGAAMGLRPRASVRHRGDAHPPADRRLSERRRDQGGRRHAELHALGRVPSICSARRSSSAIPLEKDMIPLAQLAPIQFSATSNTEYFGPMIPRIFKLLAGGQLRRGDAPLLADQSGAQGESRRQRLHDTDQVHPPHDVEVQGWLNGFNGGPMRRPTMRLNDAMMKMLRDGLVKSGIERDGLARPRVLHRTQSGRGGRAAHAGRGRIDAAVSRRGRSDGSARSISRKSGHRFSVGNATKHSFRKRNHIARRQQARGNAWTSRP